MFNYVQDKTSRLLLYFLSACLYLTLLTVLLIGTKFLFPFITLKTVYFRILIELAFPFYLLLAWRHPAYRPRFNALLWSLIAFLFVLFVSAVLGVSPYRSWWGNIERGEGLLFISHLIVYTFILAQVFKRRSEWYAFFTFSIFISLLVGLYAVAQQLNLGWVIKNSSGARWSSTLGNAAYLGAYALGHFWLSITLLSRRHLKIYWRIFYASAALFNAVLVFASETRGAMLAFALSLLFYLAYLVIYSRKRALKIFAGALLVIFVFSAFLVYFNRQQKWVKKYNFLRRLTTISLTDTTTQSRLYALDSSWRGWKDRFLLGYGWENYEVVFNKYFHPELYKDNNSRIWFDRAHNTLMDVAVAGGLLGLLVYLSIYFNAAFILWRKRREMLAAGLAMFLLGHFIQNIFVFDSLPTYIMLFSVFAFIAFWGLPQENIEDSVQRHSLKKIRSWFAIAVFLFALPPVYYFNLRPARANQLGLKGLAEIYQGHLRQGIDLSLRGIRMNTYQTAEIRERLAQAVLNFNNLKNVKDKQALRRNFQIAIEQIKDNLRRWPLHAQDYLFLMGLYNRAGLSLADYNYLLAVEPVGYRLLELSPTRPQAYFEMGKAQIYLGRYQRGLDYLQQGVNLNPRTLDAHWVLLSGYLLSGEFQKASWEYQRMLSLGLRDNYQNTSRLAKLLAPFEADPRAASFLARVYGRLTSLKPERLDYWTKLAQAYKVMGDRTHYQQILLYIKNNFISSQKP